MKKFLLLFIAGFLAGMVDAQYLLPTGMNLPALSKKAPSANIMPSRFQPLPNDRISRTTTVLIYSEDFSSGSTTSLPTGWTAGTTGGGTWKWTNTPSHSAYSMGVMKSETAANGWMIFDSDSIWAATGVAPAGWLQSPAYNCTTHNIISVIFENYYRKLNDSCFIRVSTDSSFATYTEFPVALNDDLANNVESANPTTVEINISAVAAWKPKVYIRFYTMGPPGGAYSWMIDDMALVRPFPHDAGISNSFLYGPESTAFPGSVFTTPLEFTDIYYPVTRLANFGNYTEDNIAVTCYLYESDTFVYGNTSYYSGLFINSYDTLIFLPYFEPGYAGNYMCTFRASVSGDFDTSDKRDTLYFSATDTTWMENQGPPTGSTWLNRASGHTCSYMLGTRFDVPDMSAGDTVSGFGVVFDAASVPTNPRGRVSVQLYRTTVAGNPGWYYLGSSVSRPITAADISSSGQVWAYFAIDPSGGHAPFVLQPGYSYSAIVQIDSVATDLLLATTDAPCGTGNYFGFFGQIDTSLNDGAPTFSPLSIASGIGTYVPMVCMYFGNISTLGLNDVRSPGGFGEAYPDPANARVNIPFTAGMDGWITVTVTNMAGQVVMERKVTAARGQRNKATFETSGIPPGVYAYVVTCDGYCFNGRFIVAH